MSTQEKKKEKKYIRRSGAKIMASLVVLLGSLSYIMILAVINGSLGFISAMGVTVFGAMGVAKALGEQIALSYGWIIGLIKGYLCDSEISEIRSAVNGSPVLTHFEGQLENVSIH